MNDADGCVVETRRMFHDASAASNQPARSPMRGSGLGAVVDMFGAGDTLAIVAVDPEVAHEASANRPTASVNEKSNEARFTRHSGDCCSRGRRFRKRHLTGCPSWRAIHGHRSPKGSEPHTTFCMRPAVLLRGDY